ncbi:hypothetical protein NP493_120g03026 [Ridgeia piscesae]|uniref:Uncharacterized protein n=1 Tax=Ridgeia piscesae TaxID=27915 RepID=A0AAD9UGW6_RIDPI|nr:hypothetical protein NP493_120g03026 [Ridgeia piscesae]
MCSARWSTGGGTCWPCVLARSLARCLGRLGWCVDRSLVCVARRVDVLCDLPASSQPSVVDVSGTDSYLAGPGIKIKNRRIINIDCLTTATARVCVLTARPAGLLYPRRAAQRYSYARPRDNIYIALRICIRGQASV